MWKKYGTVGQAIDGKTKQHMCSACWITKATDTQSEYVIFIAFPWQQWLYERVSMLHLHANCLSCLCLVQYVAFKLFRIILFPYLIEF